MKTTKIKIMLSLALAFMPGFLMADASVPLRALAGVADQLTWVVDFMVYCGCIYGLITYAGMVAQQDENAFITIVRMIIGLGVYNVLKYNVLSSGGSPQGIAQGVKDNVMPVMDYVVYGIDTMVALMSSYFVFQVVSGFARGEQNAVNIFIWWAIAVSIYLALRGYLVEYFHSLGAF